MQQAVENGRSRRIVTEELSPVLDRPVGSDHRAFPVSVALQNHIKQIFSGSLRQTFLEEQIINDQEIGAAEQLEQLFAFSGLRGFKDVFKETLRFPIGHLITGLDRGMRNRFGNMAFPVMENFT